MKIINNDWDNILKDEINKTYFKELNKFLDNEYKKKNIFPDKNKIYTALKLCSYKNTKVVILGQDPYHEKGQAHGLAFSVNKNIEIPPSLKNIYKEMKNDIKTYIPNHGNLEFLAKQGVLLLNTVLTVEEHKANSHYKIGWQTFTDAIISKLNDKKDPIVFILWGNNAKKKKVLITNKEHLIIESNHPSPLSASRGFFGSKPFSKANNFLIKNNIEPINWQIENI